MEKSTRPDIAYDVHQCAHFMTDPKESSELGRCTLSIADKGTILCPKDNLYSATPMPISAMNDPSTAQPRSGWVITFAGNRIVRTSKLETEMV